MHPCLITGKRAKRGSGLFDIHCHHVEGRGLGQDDHKQVPLLGSVHGDLHSMGASDFVEKYKEKNKDLQSLRAETSYEMARELKDYLQKKADEYLKKYSNWEKV